MIDVQIAISTDMGYFKPSLVAMMSVLERASAPVKVNFFGDALDDDAQSSVQSACGAFPGASLNYVDISGMIPEPPEGCGTPKSTMARLILPSLASGRVLHIDSDTMTFSDIRPLFELDLQGNLIAAVRDFVFLNMFVNDRSYHRDRYDYNTTLLSPYPVHDYFNAGIVLYDIDSISSDGKLVEEMADINAAYRDRDVDQSWLNRLFKGNVTFLDPSWNCIWGRNLKSVQIAKSMLPERHIHDLQKSKIEHYCGLIKPWRPLGWKHYLDPGKFLKYGYTALRYRHRASALLGRIEIASVR